MAGEVIGREEELEALSGFLADPASLPDVLLLEGGPGIGKTRLWNAALRTAGEQRYRTLACQPVEVESAFSFAGLRDLIDEVPREALDAIGGPQRRALEIALLGRDPEPQAPDERAISFGLVHVLRALAEAEPLLLAVDDIQWLDEASARAVGFALRRLGGAPVKVLCTTTGAETSLYRALPEERLGRIHVGPLSRLATQRILERRLGGRLPRPLVERIHEVSAGNPLFALELGRAVGQAGEPEFGAPLPLPDTVAEVARIRLRRLSEPSRRLLGLAGILIRPTVAAIRDAIGEPLATDAALRSAIEAEFLEVDGDSLRFTHPILREAALAILPASDRRDLHRRATAIASSAEERARHLALSAEGPDEEIAAEVEEASRQSMARGAPRSAAELAELATTLSLHHENRLRRQLIAADYRQISGDNGRAKELVDDLVRRLPPGPDRAEALHRLAILTPDMAAGTELCQQALSEAGDDPRLRGVTHLRLGRLLGMRGDGQAWERNLELAVAFAEESGDDRILVEAAQELAVVRLLAGRGLQRELLERAQARAERIEGLPGGEQPRFWLGMQLVFADALAEARALMERVLAESAGRGYLESDAAVIVILADLELRAGEWVRADEYAARATALAEEGDIGQDTHAAVLFARAAVDAHLGRVEAAREAAARGSGLALQSQNAMWWGQNERVLGFLAVSLGDPRDAWEHLGPISGRLVEMGIRTPTVIPILPCAVEALLGLGQLEQAEALIAEAESHGRRVGTGWIGAVAARSRGLLAGARGQLDVALKLCSEAVDRHRRLPYPFEYARSLLALGMIQRRTKQRHAARDSLQQAVAIFGELGATLWQRKVLAELRRIGGRQAISGQLTATERRVAELVVEGRSNREVAAALYVSVRAVEANLSRIYDKLGIRSRTQLVHRLANANGSTPQG